MEVACTSMIHAAAPHFLWPFAVRYAAHQLNLWPRVSLPETSPTLRWTGEVGDASRFRVWGSRAFVRDTTADKLSSRAIPCVFLGFPPDAPGWQFYHPTSRRVFASQDVTFDESVPFYRLFPYRTAPLPPPPLFLAPDPPPLPEPVEVTGDSGAAEGGAARGAASGGVVPGGVEPASEEPERAGPGGVVPGGAEPGGATPEREEPRSAEPTGAASGGAEPGGATCASGTLSATAFRVELLELEAVELLVPEELALLVPEVLVLEVLELPELVVLLVLEVLVVLALLVPEVLVLEVLELPELVVLLELEVLVVLVLIVPEVLVLEVLELPELVVLLVLEVLVVLALLVPEVLVLEVLELPELVVLLVLVVLALLVSEVLVLEALELETLELVLPALELETPELEVPVLGVLLLEAVELEALALVLWTLGLEVPVLGVLLLVTLELEVLTLEALGLEVLELQESDGGAAAGTGAGGTAPPRLFFAPPSPSSLIPPTSVLRQVLSLPSSTGLPLQPGSPLPAPSPYTEHTDSLTERREPASRPASPVRTVRRARRVSRLRPPLVPGTHTMALRPSSAPQRVPLLSPPSSSLPTVPDPESDLVRAAHPTVTRLLATVVTDPSFESAAASALVAELVDFAAACRLDYAASLVAESESVCPPSVGGECALGTDVLEDRQEDFECLAAAAPHLVAMLLAPEGDPDALDIPTTRSYAEAISGTYVDEVPPPRANIVDDICIFRVKRPPGSPPVFKARYVARGFSQRQGVDFFQTFSPTPKMTTLWVLLHVAAQRDYELHSFDFSTAFLQGSLHEEIWLRRPPGFTGSFPPGTQWSLRQPVYGLRQALREWHDTLRTTLAALGFAPSTADPSLFLRTDTSLSPFYILVYVDDLVFATADTEALALVNSELQKRDTCTDLGEMRSYLGLQIIRDRARRTIILTRSHMVQQVLQRFGFTWSSPQSTPMATGHSLSALPSDEFVEPSGPYPELVGCLMYLMTCTRPDLAYPLSILARYFASGRHRREHWEAAKRVLRYLCSTSGMGLVLGGRGDVVLTGHSDASWVDDLATQRSSQGYTFSLGSGSVSWRSTRSSSVLSSSCEAEIYAIAMAAQELRWLTYLLTDLGERPRSPPILYVDNNAAIYLV
ncbi:unnamed protein product [Closterium sp. Yama58-4]|nr:unnamed protein product [Closterium sp. Yama58-4]